MSLKKKLIIFYESYYPAYKAGGPVQSIINLSRTLSGTMDVYVVCDAVEIDGIPLTGIKENMWNDIFGVKVYYLTANQKNRKFLKIIIDPISPDVFYVNGMFSPKFSIMPLLVWHWSYSKFVRLVMSPRGMLQNSALKQKALKKTMFVNLFKTLRLQKGVKWHATDDQEVKDIRSLFGEGAEVKVVPNIPKQPFPEVKHIFKEKKSLKLVFISLITKMKNLTFALQCLQGLDIPVSFDIYGSIKEAGYWEECKKEIEKLPANITVKYLGDIIPSKVQDTFAEYHAFFLPTKGENFGHAIYESFSVGRPVIISDNTPWKDLEDKEAGFALALDKPLFQKAIRTLYEMDEATYEKWCDAALLVANNFYNKYDFEKEYLDLFIK